MWLTTRSLSDSREPIPLHSCAVWALQFTCHVQTCSGTGVCTCRGSYEHSSLFDRFALYLCFCVLIFLVWSEITLSLNGKFVEACKNLLKGCLCKYSWNQHLCFWKGNNWWYMSAEIVRFLDNVVFAVREWYVFLIIMLWLILFYDWSS